MDHMDGSFGDGVRFSISQRKSVASSPDGFYCQSFVPKTDEVVEGESVDLLNEPLVPFLAQVFHSHTFSSCVVSNIERNKANWNSG